MERKHYFVGEFVYKEGETADTAYFVVSGEVALVRGGLPVNAGKGALIGFSGLFDRPYGSTAEVVKDCVLIGFTRNELREKIQTDPAEAMAIIDAIIEVLGQVGDAIEQQQRS